MSRIQTIARRCIWVMIIGLVGFSGLTTASILAQALAATCSSSTFQACDISAPNDPSIKLNSIDHFGSVSTGGFNSTGGAGNAQIDWFHDHFGLSASGSTNTTASDGAIHTGGGEAFGNFLDTLTVPPQPAKGLNLGDPFIMDLLYHLDGTIHIDAPAFETAFVSLRWDYGFGPAGMGVTLTPAVFGIGAARSLMSTDELFKVIDQDVILEIGFIVGEPFDFLESASLTAVIGGVGGPGALVGVAEGDFLHTAILGGATVFDQFGHPVANPVVISDSGFDYVHPGAVGGPGSVPEPNSLLLAAACFGGLLFGPRRRARGKWLAVGLLGAPWSTRGRAWARKCAAAIRRDGGSS